MSYTKLPADTVICGCQKTIDSINSKRDKLFDRRVLQVMDGILFKRTREQAEEYVKDNDEDFAAWRIYGWGTLNSAKQLLKIALLAKDAGEMVRISSSDVNLFMD